MVMTGFPSRMPDQLVIRRGIVQRGENLPDRLDAFFMTVENLLHGGRLLEERRKIGQR